MTQTLFELEQALKTRDTLSAQANEVREAYEAEFAALFTAEKQAKLRVEELKSQLREEVATALNEDGVKPDFPGLVIARPTTVVVDDEAAAIDFAIQYAKELLTLKGVSVIRDWFYKAPIQNVRIQGKPGSVLLVEENGVVVAVNTPFHEEREVSVRINEKAILTALDERRYEQDKS